VPGRCVPREPSRQRDRDAHRSLPDRNDRRATSAPLFTARARRRVVSPWFQTEGSGAPGGAPYRKRLGSSQGECEKTKTPGVLVTRRAFRRSTRAVDFAVRTARPGRPFDQSGRSPEPPATGLAKPFRRNRTGTRIAPPATGGPTRRRISSAVPRSAPPTRRLRNRRPLASRAFIYSYIWEYKSSPGMQPGGAIWL